MLFDEFQGLSHLEALEILSRESEAKVNRTFFLQIQTMIEFKMVKDLNAGVVFLRR